MVTVSPFRASQLDNVFLEQKEDKKLMVSCTELLACGLEVRVTKKAGKYSAKYYSDTDKENGIVVQLKEITRSLIMKRLDKWSEPAIKKKKEKKNKKNSSNKKRKTVVMKMAMVEKVKTTKIMVLIWRVAWWRIQTMILKMGLVFLNVKNAKSFISSFIFMYFL
jgi:hypothetical protein